jgi:uncharacterized metal-binding protein YceD (DUF177 family)
MTPAGARPEFSRPVDLERIGSAPYEVAIGANEAERAALAARLGLIALPRLEARLRLLRTGPGARLRLEGHLEAEAVQACVISLEPVPSRLTEDFVQVYDLDPKAEADLEQARDIAVAPGPEDEDPEPIGPEGLDLGEAVAQQLALSLDPYPRAVGAAVPENLAGQDEIQVARENPFAALKALKER